MKLLSHAQLLVWFITDCYIFILMLYY